MKIIAEAGVNHNGSLDTAKKMVDAAVQAGADYIKFQTFHAHSLVTALCEAADYQKENAGASSQKDMLKNLELKYEDFKNLKAYCDEKGIGFLSTAFDEDSIDFIASLNPDYMKVPSGEITNLPFLRKMASTGIPVIISTGMSTPEEIAKALNPFRKAGYGNEDIILLHCTTQYPTPMEDVNLRAMQTVSGNFGHPGGYSDHTLGIEVPIAAATLGAKVVEKHFTLDRNMEGPDHKASLEPDELADMVRSIRNIEKALGHGVKEVKDSEKQNIIAARRSIVAARHIKQGEVITEEDITTKRPATGLSPMLWDKVVGSKAVKDFAPDDLIEIDESGWKLSMPSLGFNWK
ncbi:MAG: N-acetylneuraminate synthase [Muribaculaceae bacterium]|nr:N-acetylneuraminate synthase [Muribaculaceae bacterium]